MEAKRRIAAILAGSCLASAVWVSTAAAACPGESLTAAVQTDAQIEQSVLCLVNQRRADAGLRSVKPNQKLRAAALRHSADMVSQGYFEHTSPTGTDFIDRILDTGYTQGARRWVIGENLGWGVGESSAPAVLVEAWMNSPAHRANLLRGRFNEVGIGVVRGTPQGDATDGVMVSSEYGYRAKKGKKRNSRKGG